ncbi:MAG: hypothetical protein P4L83_17285 [Nevskia sp.]|nr:hypothetical protein [Nevskia sp.]
MEPFLTIYQATLLLTTLVCVVTLVGLMCADWYAERKSKSSAPKPLTFTGPRPERAVETKRPTLLKAA